MSRHKNVCYGYTSSGGCFTIEKGGSFAVECQFGFRMRKKAHHADLIWFSSDFRAKNPSKAQQEIEKWINCVRKLFGDAENGILFWWLNTIGIAFKDKFIFILKVSCFKLWTQDMIFKFPSISNYMYFIYLCSLKNYQRNFNYLVKIW